jgi:hypothetical protein
LVGKSLPLSETSTNPFNLLFAGKRLGTGCGLQALQQLTGVNFIFYYGTAYFERSGFEDPFIISVITKWVLLPPSVRLQADIGRTAA